MFTLNEDNSIYATRGDTVFFLVTAEENGEDHLFQAGDVLRFKIYGKKNAESVVLQKDFPVTAETREVYITLTEQDTKFGEVISKPTDYWYEVELNPFTYPQTIIGYDEDGAKVFKLFPEGDDIPEFVPDPEEVRIIDTELDMTSTRPVQNQAVARGIASLKGDFSKYRQESTARDDTLHARMNDIAESVATEQARLDIIISGSTVQDGAEVADIRVGADGFTYGSAGTAVREQILMTRRSVRELRSGVYTESNRNIIHPIGIIKGGGSDGLTATLDADGKVVFDGNAEESSAFYLIVESGTIPENNGDFFFRMDKSEIISQTGLTWGFAPYYTDGTNESTTYSNSNWFFPLVASGKKISKIKIVFGAGHSFNKTAVLFYTTFYENGVFYDYEPHYMKNASPLNGLKWASLGDSLTENKGNDGELWQNQVATAFGLVPIVCGKGGSTTDGLTADDVYKLIPNDVDIISVMAGTNDCGQELPLYTNGDEYYFNNGHYTGALRKLIRKLQADFPKAKIIFCTCLSARLDNAGVEQELPYRNDIGLTMADYAAKCIEVCREMGVPCIDLCGESGINTWNATSYLSDRVHPNSAGYMKIADVYIRNFKRFVE
jgi:lysophospholipase L1-like esterase